MSGRTYSARRLSEAEREDQYSDVLEAIARAGEPLSKRDLALETHRTDSQLGRIVTELRERDRLREVRDADDHRIVRYERTDE